MVPAGTPLDMMRVYSVVVSWVVPAARPPRHASLLGYRAGEGDTCRSE